MIGLEVEKIENPAERYAPSRSRGDLGDAAPERRPAARLLVNTGDGKPLQVVCGAPNARTGMKGVFSPPGTYIPGKDITLGVGTIRGVESRGMLMLGAGCEFPTITRASSTCRRTHRSACPCQVAGLDDPVIEINLTPNRAGLHRRPGIARDLGATGIGKFIERTPKPVKGAFPCPVK